MSRISRVYFSNASRRSSSPQGCAYMFTRDIPLGIMPLRSSQESSSFNVTLRTKNATLKSQLVKFMHVGQFGGYDLADATIHLVDTLALYLAAFGEIYIEIISEDTSKNLASKSLGILPRGRIFKIFNRYAQIIPSEDRKYKEPRAVWIPADKIWHLELPSVLGSPRRHRRIIKRLGFLAQPGPMFIRKEGADVDRNTLYDFMSHNRSKELAIENTVGVWGSIPSQRQIKGTTEYYYIVRRLQFSYCQALLREHIIREFNLILTREGIRNGIRVEGLTLAADIKSAMYKLRKGEIDFEKALKIIKV